MKYIKKWILKAQFISIGNSFENFEYNKTNLFLEYNEEDKDYKIFEKIEENYSNFYSTEIKVLKKYNPSDITPNFKYYFDSPKKKCKMQFSFNTVRKKEIDPIFDLKRKKIKSIFGPYGSGKTTTIIL